ncbi:MAG TPA: hypothetical protein PLH94_08220 [Fimbriimonadaceae bacterium]|nr:hypothetical protein [Fimbriimonadaceae bacterium]
MTPPAPTPKVWAWYRAFCASLALLNVGLAGIGIWFVVSAEALQSEFFRAGIVAQVGWLAIGTGVLFCGLNTAMIFLPRKPWAWQAHYVNILLAGCTICLAPVCIPLGIAWLKPEVRRAFGMHP